jgi:aminoglycoside 6'-N-acetyltransferase
VGTITFRRVTCDDFGLLARWLAEPRVARWWHHEFSPEAIERDFGPTGDGDEPAEDHLALLDGRPIGVVQYCLLADYPEYLAELEPILAVPDGAASIDYLLGDAGLVGRGMGTAMIRAFVERIWESEHGVACIIVPVNSANPASWRALRSAGFRLVARGDLEPDNPIDDPQHEILQIDRPHV